ncbi:hypothetical protein EOE67_02635 [Rheinheimera riviphila]|uniref:Translocation and assembly module TamB C-terminal domain-containing protein n=1 Tax=Rheinheimera riviphila TaxID=1834037 RepID=A0A437R2X5_9GAMM|nr:translocation/assembly module TamB domain-containing protein [Rheinheimera riviphila]RVU41120.1 hypothetical protein EOE67_02635 [Rheinheimera riviphila]
MSVRWYWLKSTLLTLLMLILVVLAIAGTNLSLQLARLILPQFVSGLHFAAVSGDLWRGAVFEQLEYKNDTAKISIQRLETRLDWRCFSGRMLCLDYLTLTSTNLEILAAAEPSTATPDATDVAAQTSPLWSLRVDALTSNDFSFNLPSLQGQITSLQSGGRFADQHLTLAATQIQGVQLVSSAEAPTDDAPFRLPDLTTLKLPIAIDLSTLQLDDVSLQQTGAEPEQPALQLKTLKMSAILQQQRWQLQLSELIATAPAVKANAKLDWQQDATGSLSGDFSAELPELVPNQNFNGTLSGPLDKLLLHLQLAGQQQASVNATLNLTQPQLPFSLQLKADALHWPLVEDGSATYHASSVLLDVEGSLDHQQFSGGLKATLPDLPNSTLQLRGVYQPPAKQLLLDELQIQTLNGSAIVKGLYDLQQQQLNSQWQLKTIQPGLYWTDYAGEFSGSFYLAVGLQPELALDIGGLDITGNIRDLPLQLTGGFKASQQTDHWRLNTEQLLLSHGPNQLSVSGGLEQQWQLAVKVNINDLAASVSQSEGKIVGEINVSGPAAEPDLALLLTGSNLNYQDDYALSSIELKAKIVDWGKKASSMSLVAKQGQAPGLQLQQLDWQLSGNRLQHDSHLLLDSHQLHAALAMTGQLKADSWQAQWQELRLKSDLGDWQLNQPTQSSWSLAKQQLSLSAFCLEDQAAGLCMQPLQDVSLKKGQLQLALSNFELASVNPLLADEQSLSGAIDGDIKVNWQQGQLPTAQLQLQGGAGKIEYQSTSLLQIPWQQLLIEASLNPQQLSAKLQFKFVDDQAASLQFGLTALDTPDKQLDARLQLKQFDLAFLQPIFSEFSQFSAVLNGDVRASGALANPLLQGQIQLENLSLNGRQAPMEISESSLTLAFADRKALLSGALRTPDGPLNISGDADWQVANGWFGSVQLSGQKLKLHLPNASFSFSPDLLFSAEQQGGLLSGEVLLENGNMEVDALPENAIRVSDDEVIRTAAIIDSSGLPPWKLSSDVRLTLGENVRLAAFGLKTKLEGVLRIRQQGLVPTIHGQVALRDGTFRAYGQDLQLRKGKLTFNGPADQPLMAIEAIRNPEKTEDGVIAGIQVDGLTDNPVIKVFSTPAKPQANALAYLLLGRDLTSSSSDKSVTTSLIGIGIASSGKLVGQLGEVFGLRELSLDTAGSGDSSKVMVSGYLSPKLQLKYGVGIFNQVGEFTLRYRLARKLFLEAVSGLNDSVDLLYQVEFD